METHETSLSHLRHDLRTALNHILGYSEMLVDSVDPASTPALAALLHELRSEAQSIHRLVESFLGGGDEGASPRDRLVDLQGLVREPLQKLVRLSAELAGQVEDGMLHDALRISAAASRLMSMITLGSTPVSNKRNQSADVNVDATTPAVDAHLLVVDDDEANRDILSRTLSRQGYHIETAESGAEALRALRRKSYDLVLLDIVMPGMDGLAVLEEIRKDPAMHEVPVVMISAFDEMANVVSCIQAGAIDYLFKPFNPVLMRARLAATLERKRLLDAERRRTHELEKLSRDLGRSNTDLERFAWAVSHDLQSPLRTMVSFMQLTQRKAQGRLDEETNRLIDDAVAAGKRMSQLIKDLLDYSQLSTRKLRTENVPLRDVILEVVADLRPQIEEAGSAIECADLPVVVADRVQLRQLLQNLISNAIKYRSPDRTPVVEISAEHQRTGGWHILVQDNGIGIREADIPHIFEMFRRLHGPDLPGSGIGLATVKRIVERLGGSISVESQEGVGSRFVIEIPEAAAQAA